MRKFILFFVFISLFASLQATDVSGDQSGIWALDNSPYNVIGDITVPLSSTLEIEAGVEVIFAGDYQITAEGKIMAEGSEDNLIIFRDTANSTGITHQGIRLEYEGTESNIFDYCSFKNGVAGIRSVDSPATITNSLFSFNEEAIHIFAVGNINPPLVHIEGNHISNSVKSGIMIAESSNVTVCDNEITLNGTGPQFRGAIQISIQSDNAVVMPDIYDNFIHNNHYQGITSVDMFSCGGINAQIHNNIISENYTGVYFYNCSGTLYDNQITNNYIEGDMNSGAGIMCYGGGATPFIAGNLISGNYGGVFLTVGAQPTLGNPEINLPYAYGLNVIENNIDINENNNSIVLNNLSSDIIIYAKNNFWGTTDIAEIDASITDSNDNSSLGTVEYLPIATEVNEYTLNIDITSDYTDASSYVLHIYDFSNDETTNYLINDISQTNSITFDHPVDISITGSVMDDYIRQRHCYYGDFDNLSVISLNQSNSEENIDLHFTAEPKPYAFKTYDVINVNGTDLVPILFEQYFALRQVKQLVYQNEENEIMLVGYQKQGLNGWESVILEEEYLFLKNNAVFGDNYTNNQVGYNNDSFMVFSNEVEILGSYTLQINDQEVTNTVVDFTHTDNDNNISTNRIEFNGSTSPHSMSSWYLGYTSFYAVKEDVQEDYSDNFLVQFSTDTETIYDTETVLLQPKSLTLLNDTLYWIPCSGEINEVVDFDFNGYTVFVESEQTSQVVNYDLAITEDRIDLADLNLPGGVSTIWVCGNSEQGTYTQPTNEISVIIVNNTDNEISKVSSLHGNYPNPFNPETTISFSLSKTSIVTIDVYNIIGQKVKTLIDESLTPGNHTIVWNGKDSDGKKVASGIYFYKMKNGSYTKTKKMILMK